MKIDSENDNPYQSPTVPVARRASSLEFKRVEAAIAFRLLAGAIGFWILNAAFSNYGTVTNDRPFAMLREIYPFFGGALLLWIALFGYILFPTRTKIRDYE